MKFLIQLTIIAVLAIVLEQFLPWWSIAIAGAAGGYLATSSQNFLAGFIAVALVWILFAVVISSNATAPLADRVAAMFSLNKILLIIITGIIGGLVTGVATVAGASLKQEKRRYY